MTDLSWWEAAPALLAAIAAVLVPGAVALSPLRMGLLARAAMAGPLSVVSIGVAGIAASAMGIPFAAWQPIVAAVIFGVLVWLAPRRGISVPGRVTPLPLVLAWLGSAAMIAVVAFAATPSPALVSQTYDNVFHISAIADILAHGDASSFTLRTLIETDRAFAFYPAGWHSIVALVVQTTGTAIPVAVNASWIAVCAAIWLPGVAWLAQVCSPTVRPATAALVAMPLGAAFGAMPYALLTWGTLYPTFLATALLPVAVAAPVLAARTLRRAQPAYRRRVWSWAAGGIFAVVGAVLFSQPRVLASWVLILAVPGAAVAFRAVREGLAGGPDSRLRTRRVLAVAAVVVAALAAAGAWYLVFRLGLFERPLTDRLGGPQAEAVQPLWVGAWQVISQSWLTGVGVTVTAPAILLAASVLFGAVIAWRDRRTRWIVIAYLVVAVLYVFAAGSDDVVTKLATALWYKDKFRLSSVLPVLAIPIATLGIVSAARLVRLRSSSKVVAVATAWLVAVVSAFTLAVSGVPASVGAVFQMPQTGARTEVVSATQVAFFDGLGETIPVGQRVLGDPWDGSAWTLAFGSREPVFPHVNGQWDAARQKVAWQLTEIDTDPAVCDALDELRVRYVVYSPHALGGGDPAGNHFPAVHDAVEAGLFTEVASESDVRLYRIDQCGPLP
ncbi:DUF6541 family protein [Microbacterium hibisci]|uniref:DUF6541 family protein n=1 Tax=Microbacterium hibisci TaxID=2036000 RepID=UPI001941EECB|nr:DUF6541 family protein [Microbacterium hibisci]